MRLRGNDLKYSSLSAQGTSACHTWETTRVSPRLTGAIGRFRMFPTPAPRDSPPSWETRNGGGGAGGRWRGGRRWFCGRSRWRRRTSWGWRGRTGWPWSCSGGWSPPGTLGSAPSFTGRNVPPMAPTPFAGTPGLPTFLIVVHRRPRRFCSPRCFS